MIEEVNTPSWDKLLEGKWALVDFWAPWCQPCKVQEPILEELAQQLPQLTILKLNIDDNRYLSQQLSVRNIPSLILYYNKVERQRFVGVQPLGRLMETINKYINK